MTLGSASSFDLFDSAEELARGSAEARAGSNFCPNRVPFVKNSYAMYPANIRFDESGSLGFGDGVGAAARAEAGAADDFIAYKASLSLRFLDAPGVKIRRGW